MYSMLGKTRNGDEILLRWNMEGRTERSGHFNNKTTLEYSFQQIDLSSILFLSLSKEFGDEFTNPSFGPRQLS